MKNNNKENEFDVIFEQLNIILEDLEKNSFYNKDQKKILDENTITKSDIFVPSNFDNTIINIIKNNIILQNTVYQQQRVLHTEKHNTTYKLGKILIEGVKSVYSFILLPFKLCKIWKTLQQKIPSKLGSKDFQKVIDAYKNGGKAAVESLLNTINIASTMRADAYCALARSLIKVDIHQATNYARLAWEIDPEPYRLKWLAFRLFESNDVINAKILLDLLPKDIHMSTWEQKQSILINNISEKICNEKALEIYKNITKK